MLLASMEGYSLHERRECYDILAIVGTAKICRNLRCLYIEWVDWSVSIGSKAHRLY